MIDEKITGKILAKCKMHTWNKIDTKIEKCVISMGNKNKPTFTNSVVDGIFFHSILL